MLWGASVNFQCLEGDRSSQEQMVGVDLIRRGGEEAEGGHVGGEVGRAVTAAEELADVAWWLNKEEENG